MLGITIQHEKPQLEVQKTELLRKEEELKVQLAELEESLLEVETTKIYNTYFKKFKIEIKIKSSLSSITRGVVITWVIIFEKGHCNSFNRCLLPLKQQTLASAEGNILENKELLESLNKTKASSMTIAESLQDAHRIQTTLDQVSEKCSYMFSYR